MTGWITPHSAVCSKQYRGAEKTELISITAFTNTACNMPLNNMEAHTFLIMFSVSSWKNGRFVSELFVYLCRFLWSFLKQWQFWYLRVFYRRMFILKRVSLWVDYGYQIENLTVPDSTIEKKQTADALWRFFCQRGMLAPGKQETCPYFLSLRKSD